MPNVSKFIRAGAGKAVRAGQAFDRAATGIGNTGYRFSNGFSNKVFGTGFEETGKASSWGSRMGGAANFTAETASKIARNTINPKHIYQGTMFGGAAKGAAYLAGKTFRKVEGGPSISAPLGVKMRKGAGIALGSVAATYTIGSSYNQYRATQGLGSVEATGPMPQMSYDQGVGVRDNLSATGDLVFAMNNLKHRGF